MVGFRKTLSPVFVAIAMALAFMAATAATPPTTSAQDDTVTVYLQPWDATAGSVIPHMCLSLEGASNVGCDENGDGYIAFQDMQPGTYTVVQETIIAGIVQLGDGVTITVADSPSEQYFTINFNELGAGDTPVPTVEPTFIPTVAPTTAAPGDSSTQSGTTAPTLPNTGTGSGRDRDSAPFETGIWVILALASTTATGGMLLRRHRTNR